MLVAVNVTVNGGTSRCTSFIELIFFFSAYYILSPGDVGFTFYLFFFI